MAHSRVVRASLLVFVVVVLITPLALAQQTGSIAGRVTTAGDGLPGVTVEAASNLLPQPRVTTTFEGGSYRLPALPPGTYKLTFSLAGMTTQTRTVQVNLDQEAAVNVELGMEGIAETVTVEAGASLIDTSSTEVKSALSNDIIEQLPVGQDYRDLVKLTPGVQHTENNTRGPSGGGSGQDNVYLFDGVLVTLPLFGTLSAEPSSHDIQQISVIKGGARAVDFNRAAGFTIDSVSKSGTSEVHGELSYQLQTDGLTSNFETGSSARFDEDKSWTTASVGAPIIRDMLFLYGSYYRPTSERSNRSNAYGAVPPFDSERNEGFGKLTFTPTSSILLHGSYRDSSRENSGESVTGEFSAGSTSQGSENDLEIAIVEGSWVLSDRSFATFKYTDFANETSGRPDNILDFRASIDGSGKLNVGDLTTQGLFVVPTPISGQTAYNEFIAPIIERYGYLNASGVRTGGGRVGVGATINDQDFFRTVYQAGYNLTLGSRIRHDLHVGYQWFTDEEDLVRSSNGWGTITAPGGRTSFQGKPIFFQAEFTRMSLPGATIPRIHSEYESQNFEINDSINWGNWNFNVGVLFSNDTLYGQGLRRNKNNASGFELAPGQKYKMYEIPFRDMIQPRVGATWAYNGEDNVYASYARYNPAASSLPRAASWDRNSLGLIFRSYFDQNGNQIGTEAVQSSTGKLFVRNLDPRYTDEFMIGTSQQLTSAFSGRLYARYRYSSNFWEDTQNNARVRWAPEGYPKELYIPNLVDQLKDIGGGSDSAYVIAQLDNAFTKYYEVTTEAEWRRNRTFVRGSYTWSHYYGTFDQDNSTNFNDDNIFIGSSNIADGAGRQIWDLKYGDLRGDRRHVLKVYGAHGVPWNATIGAFALYQSGEPWETHSHVPYLPIGGSTSDTNRFAEPAGSRKGDDHYQIDLNYTQNIPIAGYNFQVILDGFNLTDNQTGFNYEPRLSSAGYGKPQSFYAPRRYQVQFRFEF